VITFSDVEVAHFGSYSMHLAGIRTMDRLVYELWNQVQANPSYSGRTTLFVLPEFGRDFDGSNTNGFFNHRALDDSTSLTWMMCLGEAVRSPDVIKNPVQHIDLCPTIASLFGLKDLELPGKPLPGLSS
jgi:arylsulfatase A-like enzyme